MRVTALVLGLLFAIWAAIESLLISGPRASGDGETTGSPDPAGVLVALVVGLGSALVIAMPLTAALLFCVAGLAGFASADAGHSTSWIHGVVSCGLGIMAFAGWLGQRKGPREQRPGRLGDGRRGNRMKPVMRSQQAPAGEPKPEHYRAAGRHHRVFLDGVDEATTTAIANVLDPDEELAFVVSGGNATLVGAERTLIVIPSARRETGDRPQPAYAAASNVGIEPTREGGRLRLDIQGQTHELVLVNEDPIDQGTTAVRLIRHLMRNGSIAGEGLSPPH